MDKTVAGLIGALSALAAVAPAHAALAPLTVHEALHADSYADLLRPIPNAAALLKDAVAEETALEGQGLIEEVQFIPYLLRHHHHHHHHHHRYYRHHHHHHHHHHRYYRPY